MTAPAEELSLFAGALSGPTQFTSEITFKGAIFTYTPTAHGRAGADDAQRHLVEHAPGWLLEALGDALMGVAHDDFTAEDVRLWAEAQSEGVKGWLAVKGREACYGGWFVSRVELHHLERTGHLRRSTRPQARGRMLPVWRFPP